MSSRHQTQEATSRNTSPLTPVFDVDPRTPTTPETPYTPGFSEKVRLLNRSPHPYHKSQGFESQNPEHGDRLHPSTSYSKSSHTTSDSGTEADDESTGILRGLPAPPIRPRKGLRSSSAASDVESWLPSFKPWSSFVRPVIRISRRSSEEELEGEAFEQRRRSRQERQVEILRRLMETTLLLSVGGATLYQDGARTMAWEWRKGMWRKLGIEKSTTY